MPLSDDSRLKLQKIADGENVAVLTFLASDKLVRISPSSYDSASISTTDVYNLEKAIEKVPVQVDAAFVLLHSPGGSLSSSYNIARFLRKRFKKLHVFVPYEAASGATIMSLAANKITLGELGYLTPIDTQVRHKGEWVSSYGIVEKVNDLERRFKKLAPDEMPIPWRQMVEKLDLVHYREMETAVFEAQQYARTLLLAAGYGKEDASGIAYSLARTIFSHEHCFDRDACKEMGLKIDETDVALGHLNLLKDLVHEVNKSTDDDIAHCIEVAIPKTPPSGRGGQSNTENALPPSGKSARRRYA